LSKSVYDPIFKQLGWGVNFLEPSTGEYVQTRDYMSYDELVGACAMRGFRVVDPYMPHGSKQQYLYSLTGSAWLYDNIGKYIDLESLSPISILLQRVKPKRRRASHLKAKRAHDDQAA